MFWGIEERTIQRHAKAGKVPGLFKSGRRLKIRRCKASQAYGQMLSSKKSAVRLQKSIPADDHLRTLGAISFEPWGCTTKKTQRPSTKRKSHAYVSQENVIDGVPDDQNNPHFQALGAIYQLDRAKTGNPEPDEEVWTLPELKGIFEDHPELFRVIGIAVSIVTDGEMVSASPGAFDKEKGSTRRPIPTQTLIAQRLGISRRTFVRKYPEMTAARIKAAVQAIIGAAALPSSAGKAPQNVPYQTRGGRRAFL